MSQSQKDKHRTIPLRRYLGSSEFAETEVDEWVPETGRSAAGGE